MKPKLIDHGNNNEINLPKGLRGAGLTIKLKGNHNHVVFESGTIARGTTVSITGDGNVVHVGAETTVGCDLSADPLWRIEGDGNSVLLGNRCWFNPRITVLTNGGTIDVGEETTSFPGSLNLREGKTISIGRDCQFAAGWWIADSDMHPIFDLHSGERLNPPGDIVIGEHVWLAAGVHVLKGSNIGQGSVIGAGSRVIGTLPANCLAVGSPARVSRDNVRWERELEQSRTGFSAVTSAKVSLQASEK